MVNIAANWAGNLMTIATEHKASQLAMHPLAQNPQAGRWRTEAMRSHATPRLVFIAKGQGRITVAGLTRGYNVNNLIFIPAHTMYGMEVGPTVFGQILTIPAAMAAEWPAEPVHLRLRDVTVQREFTTLLDALERELKQATPSRAAHYHLGLLSVFFERQVALLPTEPGIADTTAARLVAAYTDLIERDYRSGKGVAQYAAALGVTTTHLTRCCKQTCGRAALALLNDRLTYEACVLLRESALPIRQIAADLGFTSAAYFTRAFQARMGRTPSDFRRRGAAPQRPGASGMRV